MVMRAPAHNKNNSYALQLFITTRLVDGWRWGGGRTLPLWGGPDKAELARATVCAGKGSLV
jgi:hypothetical protein